MVDEGIFATTAEVLRKTGAGVSSTSSAEAFINDYMTQAESYINVLTRTNYSNSYAGLDVDVKGLLKEAASNLAAIYAIQYDISGYNSTREAENMMNTNWKRFLHCIKLLDEQTANKFLTDTTT